MPIDPIELAQRHGAEGGDLDEAEQEAMMEWGLREQLAYRRERLRLGPPKAPPPWGEELLLRAALLAVAWPAVRVLRGWRREPRRVAWASAVVPAVMLIGDARERLEVREARRRGMTRAGDGPLSVPVMWPMFAVALGRGFVIWRLRQRRRYPPYDDLGLSAASAITQAVVRRIEWRHRGGPARS